MTRRLLRSLILVSMLAAPAMSAPTPTAEQALGLEPIQSDVDYTRPDGQTIKTCTVKPEKKGASTAWVVRDETEQVLRRFIDTNADNFVDIWSYYKDGVEVYRDIDADFNKKPDQYRWYNSGGTRWGIDENEDGKIDRWRAISAHEVAELLVEAIRNRDTAAFDRLLITAKELDQLGLGTTLTERFLEKRQGAASGFRKLVGSQEIVTAKSRFVDFGAPRPGTVPAGTDGATKDVDVYEAASALLDNDGRPEQVQLGALVAVGEAWRLVEAPQVGSEGVEVANVFALSQGGAAASGGVTGAPPSEKMQALMSDLEKLDAKLASAKPADRESLIQNRARLLRQLAGVTEDGDLREQWISQLADMLSAAVVEGTYPKGAAELQELARQLKKTDASEDLQAHVEFQTIWADWGRRSQDPKEDYTKVQDAWLKQLRGFAKVHPTSPDTAEALLQLGMAEEFAGRTDEAEEWYKQLASDFASTVRGRKAAGAVKRLNSIGKPIQVAGDAIGGGLVSLDQVRGKVALVQYWATWCEPCKSDMAQIKQLNARYGGRGFAVMGVNLDNRMADARAFLKENPLPWKHAYDEGGLDGRMATEMGVMTLPLMVLVDEKGKVVRRNLHVAELDAELKRLLR